MTNLYAKWRGLALLFTFGLTPLVATAGMVATTKAENAQVIQALQTDRSGNRIDARVTLKDGTMADLSGSLEEGGLASLRGSRPDLGAELVCGDAACKALIVDVLLVTDGNVIDKQFVSREIVPDVDSEFFTGEFTGSPRKEHIALGPNATTPPDESLDQQLAPWLDLKGGGQAVGPSQGKKTATCGALENATPFPENVPGLRSIKPASWGTGMMISLLKNSAAAFSASHNGQIIYTGGIAREHGGYFPPHASHQNGLDVDVLFVGTTKYATVLDNGAVSERFNPQLNWDYWKSLLTQKIVQNGHEIPVVSMILIAPEIKKFVCEWAAKNGHNATPEDQDLLKRLRPTKGHDTHFHTRLQCSPYYSKCLKTWDPGNLPDTGC